jgi:hypothetical protein
MVAVLAVQVRGQQHQRKRERPDNRSNPRPDFEAARRLAVETFQATKSPANKPGLS